MNREILAFNYREARSLVVCGDVHGAFEEMVFKLCVQYGMTDTLLIVAGDFCWWKTVTGMSLDSLIRICKELQIDPKSFIDA